jgi:hypothetical protein
VNDVAANALIAAPVFVVGISLAVSCALQPARTRRRGIRRLEAYANHPGVRADIRDQIRKEDRP